MQRGPGYGHAGHEWVPDLGQAPADVAAGYLQHRIVVQARERLGSRATAPRFAERLGLVGEGPTKYIQRLLAGTKTLTLPDLLLWTHAFEIDLPKLVAGGLADPSSYPGIYRALLDTAAIPVPRFRRTFSLDWRAMSDQLVGALTDEIRIGGTSFLRPDVVRHHAVKAAVVCGIPRDLIRPVDVCGIQVAGASRFRAAVASCLSEDSLPQHVINTVVAPGSLDFVILVLPTNLVSEFQTYVPGLIQSAQNDVFDVPTSSLEFVDAPSPSPVSWRIEQTTLTPALASMILSQKLSTSRARAQ